MLLSVPLPGGQLEPLLVCKQNWDSVYFGETV